MEGESGVTKSIIDEVQSWDIEGDEMEGESGVTRSIIDERDSSDTQGGPWMVQVVLLEVSLAIFLLEISNESKGKVKVLLLEVSLMNFILRTSKEINLT